jgi:hypothetical protein
MEDDYNDTELGVMGHGNVFNGSTKFINFLLATVTGLLIAAIVGGVALYGKVEAIDTKVDLIITGHIKVAGLGG